MQSLLLMVQQDLHDPSCDVLYRHFGTTQRLPAPRQSTTLSLIARYYDPDGERVRVDGQPLRSLDVQQYRTKLFGMRWTRARSLSENHTRESSSRVRTLLVLMVDNYTTDSRSHALHRQCWHLRNQSISGNRIPSIPEGRKLISTSYCDTKHRLGQCLFHARISNSTTLWRVANIRTSLANTPSRTCKHPSLAQLDGSRIQ